MSSRPWFKFYGSDWRADAALRMCSLAARGLWVEMVCLMDEATPRGTLTVKGKPVNAQQLAVLAGCSANEAKALLQELEEAEVFSRREDGTIYSRRMERESQTSASQRAKAEKRWGAEDGDLFGASTGSGIGFGNAGSMPRDQRPESRDQNPDSHMSDSAVSSAADEIWAEAPAIARKRSSKGDLQRALKGAASRRKNLATVRSALQAYYASADASKENGKYAKGVHRMVENDRWEDWVPAEVAQLPVDPTFQERRWRTWMQDWLRSPYTWDRSRRGIPPDEPGCEIPAAIMAEFNYTPPPVRAAR